MFLEIDFGFLLLSVEMLTSILIRSKSLVLTSRVEYSNILNVLFLHTPSHSMNVLTMMSATSLILCTCHSYLYLSIPRGDPIFTFVTHVGRYRPCYVEDRNLRYCLLPSHDSPSKFPQYVLRHWLGQYVS